ncbi:disulfide bond formation protein B [Erythrobacter crassostreae]|uniref:Disulfide bond formation protein B n=1 Tax=Erythrobacter crassostreae TaxID=2828328 RepID=A0A9X1F1D1_9SPHN|nr:disulfide bond formation protein B [Erythrobacter crassostrea]MBV7258526.1 disulfide bond formation protein B [Erythrobacter crassostrea]
MTGVKQAQFLAIAISAGLLGGAYISEYGFGLFPCEMCWWQRWPHFAALGAGVFALFQKPAQVWTALAGLAILTSGLIGGFHAGVEYGWWEGITGCATLGSAVDVMNPAAAPIVRCDVAPWSLFGISLAGWNFLFSTLGGIAILALSVRATGKEKAL